MFFIKCCFFRKKKKNKYFHHFPRSTTQLNCITSYIIHKWKFVVADTFLCVWFEYNVQNISTYDFLYTFLCNWVFHQTQKQPHALYHWTYVQPTYKWRTKHIRCLSFSYLTTIYFTVRPSSGLYERIYQVPSLKYKLFCLIQVYVICWTAYRARRRRELQYT